MADFSDLPAAERYRQAVIAYATNTPTEDSEMLAKVMEMEEELRLIEAFSGWDSLQAARSTNPHFVAQAAITLRTLAELHKQEMRLSEQRVTAKG